MTCPVCGGPVVAGRCVVREVFAWALAGVIVAIGICLAR